MHEKYYYNEYQQLPRWLIVYEDKPDENLWLIVGSMPFNKEFVIHGRRLTYIIENKFIGEYTPVKFVALDVP